MSTLSEKDHNMRQFFTPPINESKFNANQSLKASYSNGESNRSVTPVSSNTINTENSNSTNDPNSVNINEIASTTSSDLKANGEVLTQEEIDTINNNIHELPTELLRLIEIFITDLKQPKYVKPLNIIQLASLFQAFYVKFDKASYQYLTNLSTTNTSSFFSAREVLSTGLSGIFARSRSSSATNTINRNRNRRSSSLLSTDSVTNLTNAMPLLSPEEIDQQLKKNATDNIKIEKYLELCEKAIFKRLLEVGTSAVSPLKVNPMNSSGSNSYIDIQQANQKENFNVKTLFRNTPKFIEFDDHLRKRIKCLNKLSKNENIKLNEFLGISDSVDIHNVGLHEEIDKHLNELVFQSISPCDKVKKLLDIHQTMTQCKAMSNDDFLSVLIYHIIRLNPRNMFLNEEFIKLFRYKKKLVENEMFALTNLDAALVFIEGLTLNDFSKELQTKFTKDELEMFETRISEKIILPTSSTHDTSLSSHPAVTIKGEMDSSSSLHLASPSNPELKSTNRDSVMRTNSYEGIKSVFDGSLKNIISKMKSYTPTYQDPTQPMPIQKSNSQLFIDFDKPTSSSPLKLDHVNSNNEVSLSSFPVSNSSIPEEWCKFKNIPFDDLKINQLREMYEIYQKLID